MIRLTLGKQIQSFLTKAVYQDKAPKICGNRQQKQNITIEQEEHVAEGNAAGPNEEIFLR